MDMELIKNGSGIPFLIETCSLEGVKRIAGKVAQDVKRVSNCKPEIITYQEGLRAKQVVLFVTLGESELLDQLVQLKKVDVSPLEGKREVYKIQLIDNPLEGIEQMLLICGSDKRGTIYGMFALSEYIGVSPLYFWGDVKPLRKDTISISSDIENISKETSVKYRGFFINDEWPCFGNWTFSHYGGFTAEMYDHVFELLLRLKGNYLWPAMWSSSFPLDGPGELNEELAHIYGVVIGQSHHEPCLRASEEWDKVRGEESPYGNEWNFLKNEKGLLKYWEDGLKRSGKYEKLITIGMRGERDSSMGDDYTLKDNIDLLKDIITKQRKLIKENVNEDLSQVPQLLAIYKEVEDYYYGDENTPGLKDWEELDGVICMLCEDNFGHMRTLPTKDTRSRNGGFGMYYHFDYHGGPISYEWVTSTPFTKVWEQMTMAYDYGVRDAWIVNVGDLKFNEIPLAYFLSMAYDFDKWGTTAPNRTGEYTKELLNQTFPDVTVEIREKMAKVLKDYIDINGLRRPESLHAGIYHPCNYLETDRMLQWAKDVDNLNEEVYESLNEDQKETYYSLIYYPAKASLNLLRMHLYAGKNAHYAAQGKTVANEYAKLVTECIQIDKQLVDDFSKFKTGKWDGMGLAPHIGFVKWNEDNCRYPIRMEVEPAYKPRMTVSRKDDAGIAVKNYGSPMAIQVDDFLFEGNTEVILEIANDGIGEIQYDIEVVEVSSVRERNQAESNQGESNREESEESVSEEDLIKEISGDKNQLNRSCDWLSISSMEGKVKVQTEVKLQCDRSLLPKNIQTVKLLIKDGETTVAVNIKGKAVDTQSLEPMTFLEKGGVITMDAHHFYKKQDTKKGGFHLLNDYGRSGYGMKVFPTTTSFGEMEDKASLTYRFQIENAGEYLVEVRTAPMNPVVNKQGIHYIITDSHGVQQLVTHVPTDFRAGESSDNRWSEGVLNQVHKSYTKMVFEEGIEEITIGAMEAGFVLERILIYPTNKPPKSSYLGPEESFYKE